MIITLDTERFPEAVPQEAHIGDLVSFTITGRISKLEANLIGISSHTTHDALPGIIEATIYITEIKRTP